MHADRHPERTVLYRVLFHYFERFLIEYKNRFEREYGYFRPIIKEVTEGHHEAWKADSITSLLFRMACLLRCLLGRSSLFSLGKS